MGTVIAIPQMGTDLFRKYMKSKYVQSLRRAGAETRWIELEDTEKAVAEVLACDGLLIPGGADVDPRLYQQEPTEKCGEPNPLRDKAEPAFLKAFLPSGKPVLCICRGFQVLNVFYGGALLQDISDVQKCRHVHIPSASKGIHKVEIAPGTKLCKLLGGQTSTIVNSLHHQAIDRVGGGLTVSAVSEDGFVEALELGEHPFCVGVQWHPEHMSKRSQLQQGIFNAFVAACK